MDRDPLYTGPFRRIVEGSGVKIVRLPTMSPNLNAFAERFVLSIKSECLERMVPLGEGHLRRAIVEYMAHYHGERNHQGLCNALINGAEDDSPRARPIVRRDRIGGLIHSITGGRARRGGPISGIGRHRVRQPVRRLRRGLTHHCCEMHATWFA